MKKRKFNAKTMKRFTTEPKVVHEAKPIDLITQYNRMRSIAIDIYNSDFFMISSKAEQKKIEASIACISATMISMIGMEAIKNSHDCLPDDSDNGDDHSWDNLPDDSGDYTDTDKASHDAIEKMKNIAYDKSESDGVKKVAARLALNSVHGAPSHIMAMNRRILSELGIKSPADKPDEDPFTFGNEHDDDSDEDADCTNLGNFADGPFYSEQYRHICQIYGFNIGETLKRIVKAASDYTISKLNLVGVVSDKHDIKSDDKYYPNTGDIFFVTNKENDKDPVFVLINTKSYLELFDFDIDKVSVEIKPVELEESTKTNYIEFVNSDAYFNIGKVHLNPNSNQVIDLDATLEKIKDEARKHGIDTITFVDTIGNSLDVYTKGKYTLEPGSLFCHRGNGWLNFMLIIKDKGTPDTVRFIWPVEKPEESTKLDDIKFTNPDAYFNIGKVHMNQDIIINLDATLEKIKDEARKHGIDTITFVDTIEYMIDISTEDKYTLKPGDVFFYKGDGWENFMLVIKDKDASDRIHVLFIEPVGELEENTSSDDIEFVGSDAYYNIDKSYSKATIIDLDATLIKIKEMAKEKGIKTITFVDSIDTRSEIFNKNKYSLEIGSLFFVKKCINLMNFILVTETGDTPSDTRVQVIKSVVIKKDDPEGKSDSNKDGSHDVVDAEVEFEYTPYESRYINDLATSSFMAKDNIEFIGIDDYYNIDRACPNSTIIDLDATLAKIKERAKAKNIKTITFAGIIKGFYEIFYKGKYYQAGSLFYTKNDERTRFILITGTIDYVNLPQYEHIDPVVVFKKDDSEDESDSKEDGIEVVEAEDEIVDSDEASSDHCINDQYADVDTSKLNHDIYAGVSFPIFMKPTESGKYVSFADVCDVYNFDVSETIKRIKNVVYQENIGSIKYVDTIWSCDEIFRKDENDRYVYGNGSLFLMVNYTNAGKDPYFVILRKMWDDHVSEYVSTLYRINPVMKSAKINNVKEIKVIDDYADGNVRITKDLKNIISIEYDYKIKEICEKRNYDYEKMISCLRGVTAIIGGGTYLTFEGSVDSLNSIVSVDPVVAYKTCSVFFVSGFVDSEKGPYFVIYMPITGKTKNGYNFHLYRIYPILNLNQDSNTDSQDDSNVREISQFTKIYRANLEVSEADKDAYMKVEFSNIDRNDGEIQSLANICYTWKFKFYDTIKRIRFVAYMSNFEEIKYAGTACSHEEILEKEVLYSNGSALFVSDEEDPHFVIVEFINRSTRLIRINPVKE